MIKRGFTMLELVVALLAGSVMIYAGYSAILMIAKSEQSVDKRAWRAITTGQLMEHLLSDLRSASNVTEVGPGNYKVTRHVAEGGPLRQLMIQWTQTGPTKITRTADGRTQTFSFDGQLDPQVPALKLRLSRQPDALFAP